MTAVQVWTLVVGTLNLLLLTISVSLVYVQMRKNHDWNRRKESQDLIFKLVTGDIANLRRKLDIDFGVMPLEVNQDFATIAQGISEENRRREFESSVKGLFNYFEAIATGVKNHVLDEEICRDYACLVFSSYWRWGQPFIRKLRVDHPAVMKDFEFYAKEWGDYMEQEAMRIRRPGKRPT